MRIIIEMIDGEDEAKVRRMFNADKCYRALQAVRYEIFRPARRSGFSEKSIADAFAKTNEILVQGEHGDSYGAGHELLDLLEVKFNEILNDSNLNLDDY